MRKTILCVDDSPTIRMLVNKALGGDWDIIEAEDGMDGLEKSKGMDIDLFIVDLHMPKLDGFGFVREIKSSDKHKNIPVIFLTTDSSASNKNVGKELGVQGWIVKPFDPSSLVKVVNLLIG